MIVSPSILAADFNNLDKEIEKVDNSSCEWIHLDVMDGKFVPNTTFDEKLIKELRKQTKKIFDVHLMIENPDETIDKYYEAGADYVTFHYEACEDISKVLKKCHEQQRKIGISIKPGTDVIVLDEYLKDLDLILIMSVEPGKGGQKFMPSAISKIEYLKEQKQKNGYKYLIEVDGGINYDTAKMVKDAGCEAVVAGTYLFKNDDFIKVTKELGEL